MFGKQIGYNGNVNLRAAGIPVEYTQDQMIELAKCSEDVKYFIKNYCKIVSLDKGLVGFDLFPYQERFVDVMVENRFSIGKLGRQAGKCVGSDTKIIVKNSLSGVIIEMTAVEFHNLTKEKSQNGKEVCSM